MDIRQALLAAQEVDCRTIQRRGQPESLTILMPVFAGTSMSTTFFRDEGGLEKVWTLDDLTATDWEAA